MTSEFCKINLLSQSESGANLHSKIATHNWTPLSVSVVQLFAPNTEAASSPLRKQLRVQLLRRVQPQLLQLQSRGRGDIESAAATLLQLTWITQPTRCVRAVSPLLHFTSLVCFWGLLYALDNFCKQCNSLWKRNAFLSDAEFGAPFRSFLSGWPVSFSGLRSTSPCMLKFAGLVKILKWVSANVNSNVTQIAPIIQLEELNICASSAPSGCRIWSNFKFTFVFKFWTLKLTILLMYLNMVAIWACIAFLTTTAFINLEPHWTWSRALSRSLFCLLHAICKIVCTLRFVVLFVHVPVRLQQHWVMIPAHALQTLQLVTPDWSWSFGAGSWFDKGVKSLSQNSHLSLRCLFPGQEFRIFLTRSYSCKRKMFKMFSASS